MALIKCPKCYKEISYKANSCPNCGYPLSETITSGSVIIKIPDKIAAGFTSLFSYGKAEIRSSSGLGLWQGLYGENASFTISEPTRIIIDLGDCANQVLGIVYPGKKYSLILDTAVHMRIQMLATYRLIEVDHIDAD